MTIRSVAVSALLLTAIAAAPASIRLLRTENVTVARRCAADHPTQTVLIAIASQGYGLCDFADKYTGGEALYRFGPSGLIGVGGGGGEMEATDMTLLYHVPSAIGRALTDARNAARRAKGIR